MERSATILNAFNIEWITTAAVTGFFSIVAFNSWWGLLEWVPLSDVITLISSPSTASWRSFLLFAVNEKPQFNQVTSSNQVGEHSLHHSKKIQYEITSTTNFFKTIQEMEKYCK